MKFKIGDEVEIVSALSEWANNQIGKKFIISENPRIEHDGTIWYENIKGAYGYRWRECDLKLVEEKRYTFINKISNNTDTCTYTLEQAKEKVKYYTDNYELVELGRRIPIKKETRYTLDES